MSTVKNGKKKKKTYVEKRVRVAAIIDELFILCSECGASVTGLVSNYGITKTGDFYFVRPCKCGLEVIYYTDATFIRKDSDTSNIEVEDYEDSVDDTMEEEEETTETESFKGFDIGF